MINLNKLSYLYPPISMCFDLAVKAGERVAILGPSGAGKSTLLHMIAGFVIPQSGNLILNGSEHIDTLASQRPVSMLFQENNLFAHLTVEQNIGLGLNPGLKLNDQQQQKKLDICQRVGLIDYLDRLPSQLSGGQRQRTALARCLVRNQPILLLDEPFSALDPALRYDMLDLVESVCEEELLTLLMVSHNLEDAARIALRALLVVEGNIAYDGLTHDLLAGKCASANILGVLHQR